MSTTGLFCSLCCGRQLKNILTLIFWGVKFYSCYRDAFSSGRGREVASVVVNGRRVLSRLSLWSCILNYSSELWLCGLFFSSNNSMAFLHPLLIQLVISWAGNSHNFCSTLFCFHPKVLFCLQQDMQALVISSYFRWHSLKAKEILTVLGLQPFNRDVTYSSTKVSDCWF